MRLEPHKISVFEEKLFSRASAKFSSESVILVVPPEEKWIRGTPGILLLLKEKSMNLKNSGGTPGIQRIHCFLQTLRTFSRYPEDLPNFDPCVNEKNCYHTTIQLKNTLKKTEKQSDFSLLFTMQSQYAQIVPSLQFPTDNTTFVFSIFEMIF